MSIEQRITVQNYFGGCPHCGDTDGYLNVRSAHWFVCDSHKVRWCVGSNLFSCWRDETEAEQRLAFRRIEHYAEVEPLPEGLWSTDADVRSKELEAFRRSRGGSAGKVRVASFDARCHYAELGHGDLVVYWCTDDDGPNFVRHHIATFHGGFVHEVANGELVIFGFGKETQGLSSPARMRKGTHQEDGQYLPEEARPMSAAEVGDEVVKLFDRAVHRKARLLRQDHADDCPF